MSTMPKAIQKEIENTVNLNYDTVLIQIKNEIKQSRDYVKSKRIEFRDRLKLYNNQRKQRDKIGDTSIYNIMNIMLAVYYMDQMQVSFKGREISDISAASNIENTAKFDYEEMDCEIIDYMTQWDRLFFGVGLRVLDGWDNNRKTPLAKSMDALCWLPDPAGYQVVKNFRWSGFEVEYSEDEMTEEAGFFNFELLKRLSQNNSDNEYEQSNQARQEAQNLDGTDYQKAATDGGISVYNMVDLYTKLKGDDGITRKYLITTDDAVTEIFRCEELEPVTIEEKKDLSLVPFPFTLNYYSPTRNDPFGVSVPDLVEDKQRAKSVLKNLRIASRKADLYPMYLYNRDKILNRRDLDFAFNKFIAVRGDVDSGVVQPLNKVNNKQGEILNDEQSLDRDVEISTGADKVTQGVMASQDRTLGEVEQVQANANLRFMLGSRINAWGEKRFWKLWLRQYRGNLIDSDKKTIRIQSAWGDNFQTILQKDFITKQDPDIKIGSKLEMEQQRLRDRVAFAAIMPIINQDPTKPTVSKRFAERHLLRLYNLPPDQIAILSPETPDEMRSKMENELLNNNEKVEVRADIEDHLSHILIHGQGEKTPANFQHIQAHKIAYYESGQAKVVEQARQASLAGAGQQVNSAQNTISNQDNSLNNNNKPAGGLNPIGG